MAEKAKPQNFDPAAIEKIALKAKKEIFTQIDNINSALASFRAKCKPFKDKIRNIKNAAKDDGVSLGVLNEAIMLEKASRAQANRHKKMEPDDVKLLKRSKSLHPSKDQYSLFFAEAPAAEPKPETNAENVTQLRK